MDSTTSMCDTSLSPTIRPDTSASYLRKIKKPLIERKRRERINTCLSQLKNILLENIKQNGGTQVSKLDKADILEMTVSHLRQIHHQQLSVAMAASATVVQQYREGYTECANEAVRYMEASQAYPVDVMARARTHLKHQLPYTHGHAFQPTSYTTDSDLLVRNAHNTPIKVKVGSPRLCKSVSPVSGNDVRKNFSPLLMPVPVVKQEVGSTSGERCHVSASSSSDECKASQSSVLSLPSRVPVSVGDSPSQKQVWRPF